MSASSFPVRLPVVTRRASSPATASAVMVDEGTGVLAFRGRPAYVWCFVSFLVADVFSGYTHGLGLPIGPDRLLLALTGLLLILDARVAWRSLRLRPVHLAALATVVVAGLSAISVGSFSTSLGFFALLDRLVVPYLAFAAAPLVFREAADRKLLVTVLAALGVYLGVTAVFEVIGPKSLVFPRYIRNPAVGIQFGRARGPFAESEADGLTLVACGYAAMLLMRSAAARRGRWFGGIAAVICAVGALLTLTRSVWLGMALGLILVAIADRRLRAPVVIGAVGVAAVAAVSLASIPALQSRVDQRASASLSIFDRQNTDAAALRVVQAHPLTGIGWSEFLSKGQNYVRQSPNYPLTHTDIEVHNVVLSRLAEIGVPGAAIWLLSVLFGPGLALRRPRTPAEASWRLAFIGAFSAWAVSVMFSPLPYPLPNALVWLFAGLALSSYLTRPATPEGVS
jgi:O-antigen ligase